MEKAPFTIAFGKNLKEVREKLGINQSELARMCFKDRQYIHRIEKGTITPTIYTVCLICKELKIEISCLLPNELLFTPDNKK
jgi:transcriptional regulator with XRE-family HTH domain